MTYTDIHVFALFGFVFFLGGGPELYSKRLKNKQIVIRRPSAEENRVVL